MPKGESGFCKCCIASADSADAYVQKDDKCACLEPHCRFGACNADHQASSRAHQKRSKAIDDGISPSAVRQVV